jgi:hypothetical protein
VPYPQEPATGPGKLHCSVYVLLLVSTTAVIRQAAMFSAMTEIKIHGYIIFKQEYSIGEESWESAASDILSPLRHFIHAI